MVELAVSAYLFLLPVAWLVFGVGIVVLGPLALFRGTRPFAGLGFFLGSFVIGLTTWLLGSAVTLGTYGLGVAVIGWLVLGVGVVPIAIFASFFTLGYPAMGWSLIVMSIVTFAFRAAGSALSEA
jgi:hypothetical protein